MKIFIPWVNPLDDYEQINQHIAAWVSKHRYHVYFHRGETNQGRFFFLMFENKMYEVNFRLGWSFATELDWE